MGDVLSRGDREKLFDRAVSCSDDDAAFQIVEELLHESRVYWEGKHPSEESMRRACVVCGVHAAQLFNRVDCAIPPKTAALLWRSIALGLTGTEDQHRAELILKMPDTVFGR